MLDGEGFGMAVEREQRQDTVKGFLEGLHENSENLRFNCPNLDSTGDAMLDVIKLLPTTEFDRGRVKTRQ